MSQNNIDSVSYSLGVLIGKNLKDQGFSAVEGASFLEAMNAVLSGQPTNISVEMANQVLNQEMSKKQMSMYSENKEAGESFLAQNATKDNVKVLESGVQYEIIQKGDGPVPSASDKVKVHYHGTLIDGKVFDSSIERGQPISFPVGGVIQGWQEILQLMPVGSKWKVYIPYDKAYGERGAGSDIKPYSALIFEVELLEIE